MKMDIKEILKKAIDQAASDIHIQPGLPLLLRINGDLIAQSGEVLTKAETQEIIYAMLTSEEIEEFKKHLVLELAINLPEIGHFRASVFHQSKGIGAVFRLIPDKVPSFDELHLPQIFKRLLSLPHGLILVTGPTGSGKSTTLAAMIDYINSTSARHIVTIEDPIEFVHKFQKSSITQLQVGRDTTSFDAALRASLRQDPNVIMLGEMRDLETIRLALTGAETGHLVLATLHASSAPLAISRLIDVFPQEEQPRVRNILAETFQAAICQTLVKDIKGTRVAAFEIMYATPAISHMIRQHMVAQMETTMQTSGDIGMCTMTQYLQKLVNQHVISPTVLKTVTANRESFKTAKLPKDV